MSTPNVETSAATNYATLCRIPFNVTISGTSGCVAGLVTGINPPAVALAAIISDIAGMILKRYISSTPIRIGVDVGFFTATLITAGVITAITPMSLVAYLVSTLCASILVIITIFCCSKSTCMALLPDSSNENPALSIPPDDEPYEPLPESP